MCCKITPSILIEPNDSICFFCILIQPDKIIEKKRQRKKLSQRRAWDLNECYLQISLFFVVESVNSLFGLTLLPVKPLNWNMYGFRIVNEFRNRSLDVSFDSKIDHTNVQDESFGSIIVFIHTYVQDQVQGAYEYVILSSIAFDGVRSICSLKNSRI